MSVNTTAEQEPVPIAGETGAVVKGYGEVLLALAPVAPLTASRAGNIWPHWLGTLVGRLVLRVCSPEKAKEACVNCRLRVFCNCAQEDWRAACVVENRFWLVLAACGAALSLYCFL